MEQDSSEASAVAMAKNLADRPFLIYPFLLTLRSPGSRKISQNTQDNVQYNDALTLMYTKMHIVQK